MSRDVVAIISQAALQHNFTFLRTHFPEQSILAMVKSNAYGHGLVNIAKSLVGMDAYGVACVEEAMQLRAAGIEAPIVLMPGFSDAAELAQCVSLGLVPVIHAEHQLALLEHVSVRGALTVWLKIDSGMHRLGFLPNQFLDAYQRLQHIKAVKKPLGLMTHLANADDRNSSFALTQIQEFEQLTRDLPGPRSIANSAAILRFPELRAQWIRPGLMLYGVSPFSDDTGPDHGLKPVMTLQAKLIARHYLEKGSSVGYGCTFRCPKDMWVGVVGIGYGDGYPWHAKTGTSVLIAGKRCALVGRVSMDMITVDLSACEEARVGDRVILWGDGLPVEEIARHAGTIPYQLFCNLTSRVKWMDV